MQVNQVLVLLISLIFAEVDDCLFDFVVFMHDPGLKQLELHLLRVRQFVENQALPVGVTWEL